MDHILVVDDDPSIRGFLTIALESEGYGVKTAVDGVEALNEIERSVPAVMLLDLQMPRLDGVGVALRLRERGRWLPIVVMTADPNIEKRCQEIGAAGFLPKPFDLDELLQTVSRLCRGN